MPLIRTILVDDNEIPVSRQNDVFGDFFGIDSCHVVLGKNGAGKTSLLVRIATMLAQQRGEVEVFVDDDIRGVRMMNEYDRKFQGVVFYTGLPYRRKIPSNLRIVDASAKNRDRATLSDLTVFKRVSEELNVQTTLSGTVEFTSAVFYEVLMPALHTAVRRQNVPHSLNEIYQSSLSPERSHISYDDNESATSSMPLRIDPRFSTLELDRGRFVSNMREFLFQIRPHRIAVVELAAVQMIASQSRDRVAVGLAYFNYLGLLHHEDRTGVEGHIAEVSEATLRYLERQPFVKEDRDRLSFSVDLDDGRTEGVQPYTAVRIGWSQLSSGMQALIDQFSRVRNGIERLANNGIKDVLLLIDEGDAYLHLAWQRRYMELLNRFLSSLKSEFDLNTLQVLLTTHSPVITTDFPSSMVTNLDEGVEPTATFAAPLDEVAVHSFGTNPIGTFTAAKLNELHERIKIGTTTNSDKALLEEIGDVLIKNALLRAHRNSAK